MIIITGAAGFIGSCLVGKLNNKGIKEIGIVDDFSHPEKTRNTEDKAVEAVIDRNGFAEWFRENNKLVEFVFHIGARTDTTEFDMSVLDELNLNYSKEIWRLCVEYQIPLIYASSAATYGDGSLGYRDDHDLIPKLQPLNPYGISKNEFDKWVLTQTSTPPYWCGLKFFNVYGPNEYHKGRMASVVFHAYNQIRDTGSVRLFRSHNPEYKDGEQLRDFIYVKDVIDVMYFMMNHQQDSGIYNLGTGNARTFIDLVTAVFNSLNLSPQINFIDTPADIRDKYQYFTEADMGKLRSIGYKKPFTSIEQGIMEYVQGYLMAGTCF
ncbi:MAG: ADP-glyceromanno-heptose 6-epimerase [Bacteroidales bacterium]|nr:ADP-glyceromanno-heptose 6-epimerase [Bacteroidota bacterium]MBL6950109.1 ADP-glyceromanno-heptose 6-epimerase [Bacteroidales bacterium]